MELTEFVEMVCAGVRDIGAGFEKPDDDWLPFLFIENEQGVLILAQLGWCSQAEKRFFGDVVIPLLITEQRAVKVALVTSAWMRYIPKELAANPAYAAIPPSQAPDRFEVVCVSAFARGGAALTASAMIFRDGVHPPALGEWETATADAMGGAMAMPLVRALEAVALAQKEVMQ